MVTLMAHLGHRCRTSCSPFVPGSTGCSLFASSFASFSFPAFSFAHFCCLPPTPAGRGLLYIHGDAHSFFSHSNLGPGAFLGMAGHSRDALSMPEGPWRAAGCSLVDHEGKFSVRAGGGQNCSKVPAGEGHHHNDSLARHSGKEQVAFVYFLRFYLFMYVFI